jgi:GntR family transcriptional regulator, transcriptional repressor for pyruvate dehydrogenase complex
MSSSQAARRYTPLAKEDLSDRAARELRTAILAGDYAPGERLPSERELSEQFGVDRHTLRSAVHELELLGLIQRRQGAGAHVLPHGETATLDLVPFLIHKPGTDEMDLEIVASVVDVSTIVYDGVVGLVAARADEDDLAVMQAALDDLEQATRAGSVHDIFEADRRLLRTIFRGAHSIVCDLFVNSLERMFTAALDPAQQLQERWAMQIGTAEGVRKYRSLLTAIEKHDVNAARKAMATILPSLDLLVGELVALDDGR